MSNKSTIIIVILILILAFLVVLGVKFFSGNEDSWICQDGQWVKHGNPSASAPITGCEKSSKAEEKEDSNVDLSGDDNILENKNDNKDANIVMTEPVANQSVGLPLVIKGEARVFENTVSFRIKDSEGKTILESYAMADSKDMGQFGPFEVRVNYPEIEKEKGTVEVFEYSAKDGSEINKVSIPVAFKKVESMNVKVFFGNRKEDPDGENCGQMYDVSRRIPKTSSVAKKALTELIFGPYAEESDGGYFSQIDRNVKMNKILISGGIAQVDFSKELIGGEEGSCEKEMIKAQITETLKQFPTVKEVKITVEGKENIL